MASSILVKCRNIPTRNVGSKALKTILHSYYYGMLKN